MPEYSDEQSVQKAREPQGPGTKVVMKGLKHALPRIAERHGQDLREHRRASRDDDGKIKVSMDGVLVSFNAFSKICFSTLPLTRCAASLALHGDASLSLCR